MYQSELSFADTGNGLFIPPTLVWDVQSTSRLVMEEAFGPVMTIEGNL